MRRLIAATLAGFTGLFSFTAAAQDSHFANQGYVTISAERLFGIAFTHDTEDDPTPPGTEHKQTLTLFGFGSNLTILNPYVAPQLGVDYFVIDGLSLGAAFSLWTISGETETTSPNQPSQTNNFSDVTLFRMTPRVGYGIMFTDIIGLWGRGGLTYYSQKESQDDGDENWEHGWAVTLEGLLMISPLDHFAIHIGPTFDIGFAGEDESNPAEPALATTTHDHIRRQYGVQGGLSGWF
jgi:hypothetical protein